MTISRQFEQAVLEYAKLLEVDQDYSRRIKQTGMADGCMWKAFGIERPTVAEIDAAAKRVCDLMPRMVEK